MRKSWIAVACLSAALGAGSFVLAEDDKPVEKKDIPAAVLKTATQFGEGGELEKCVLADEDGVEVYELHMKKGDRKIEVQTLTNGDLFMAEEKVSESAVPDLVKKRAAKAFANGAKLSYERATIVVYEVSAKNEKGEEVELLINQAGAAFKEVAGGILEEGKDEKKD